MLSFRKGLWGLVVVANLVVASSAQAQYQTSYPGAMQPFTDFNLENYDFQWFAPPISEQYGQDTIDPNHGIFFEYHRLFMNVERDDHLSNIQGDADSNSGFDGDSTWGNRFDIGYMTPENHGWLLSVTHLDGPAYDEVNRADYNSVELNRTWRLKQFHSGFWIEPFIGMRGTQFNDKTTHRREYLNLAAAGFTGVDDADVLELEGDNFVENTMILGQIGTRVFSHRGNWMLNGEVRAFAGHNEVFVTGDSDQILGPDNPSTIVVVDNPSLPEDLVTMGSIRLAPNEYSYSNSIVGGEFSVGASYYFTREIALDFSWDTMLFSGIGRNPDFPGDSQSVLMTGLGFGLTLNR